MRLFDTHAHLADNALWVDIDTVLTNMVQADVRQAAIICTSSKELERAKRALELFSNRFVLAAATGPNEALQEGDLFFPCVEQMAKCGALSAIGETGLDLHWNTSPLDVQIQLFIRYLDLARECKLPVVIHCRKAFKEIIGVLDKHYIGLPGAVGGVFHCFAEGLEEAKEVIDRGFLISFSGIITYKSASYLEKVATLVSAEQYVVETDSPYLNPGKNRSARNEPAHITRVVAALASWRGQTISQVADDTYANACRFFNMPQSRLL